MESCIRCGSVDNLENHHVVGRVDGGGDDVENKEWRCCPCHHFEHTKRRIMRALVDIREQGQADRVLVLERRLEVLENLNTPDLIRERGIYQSYWVDESTHYLPPFRR